MRHPFELELSEIEKFNFQMQELSEEESDRVAGGSNATTKALGEEGGGEVITQACFETGCDVTTKGWHETGNFPIRWPRPFKPTKPDKPEVTTLALGEEGGHEW